MLRRNVLIGLAALGASACSTSISGGTGAGGRSRGGAVRIDPADEAAVKFRMLDSVNSLRRAAGVQPVVLDARLTAAAATHTRDMYIQNRPWLFGSDGSSPLDRARRVGFPGRLLGENISESFETELQTLAAWMAQPDTRAVIMDPKARYMGFAWFQEESLKTWWTLNMGSGVSGGSVFG